MIAALVYHADIGLILFDSGSCEDVIKSWGNESLECTPRIWSKEKNSLPAAIMATGAGTIHDIKAVVLSHLHLDHAGGLEHFFGTGEWQPGMAMSTDTGDLPSAILSEG